MAYYYWQTLLLTITILVQIKIGIFAFPAANSTVGQSEKRFVVAKKHQLPLPASEYSKIQEKDVTGCEEDKLLLKCPNKFDKLVIYSTFYGRADNKTCRSSVVDSDTMCEQQAQGVSSKIQELCSGENKCKIPVDADFLGHRNSEICPRIRKYLKIAYKCAQHPVVQKVCGNICPNSCWPTCSAACCSPPPPPPPLAPMVEPPPLFIPAPPVSSPPVVVVPQPNEGYSDGLMSPPIITDSAPQMPSICPGSCGAMCAPQCSPQCCSAFKGTQFQPPPAPQLPPLTLQFPINVQAPMAPPAPPPPPPPPPVPVLPPPPPPVYVPPPPPPPPIYMAPPPPPPPQYAPNPAQSMCPSYCSQQCRSTCPTPCCQLTGSQRSIRWPTNDAAYRNSGSVRGNMNTVGRPGFGSSIWTQRRNYNNNYNMMMKRIAAQRRMALARKPYG